jgi:uncharacterized heparinase superfamily protein
MNEKSSNTELKPLKITCTSTDCANNLHCFRLTKKLLSQGPSGRCRNCGVQLVEWSRVHKQDISDVSYTFQALRYELIRHHFWHIQLSQRAINYARRKGKRALRHAAEHQIRKLIGDAEHPREGRQTPRETSPHANAIHYAQHATASCCRRCVAEWHGIVEGRALSEAEISYLTELAMLYINDRLPDLADDPCEVPKIRASSERKGRKRTPLLEHAHAS